MAKSVLVLRYGPQDGDEWGDDIRWIMSVIRIMVGAAGAGKGWRGWYCEVDALIPAEAFFLLTNTRRQRHYVRDRRPGRLGHRPQSLSDLVHKSSPRPIKWIEKGTNPGLDAEEGRVVVPM